MVPVFRLSKWTGLYDHQIAVILLQAFSALGPLAVWLFVRSIPGSNGRRRSWIRPPIWSFTRKSFCRSWYGFVRLGAALLCGSMESGGTAVDLLQDETLLPASLSLNDLELKNTGPYAGAVLYSVPVLLIYAATGVIFQKNQLHDQSFL
jgi:ABC-type glycerol-3-phosphate transport system permease component